MDPTLRAAIGRIDIVQQGKRVSHGTGTLVTDRLVLTALHVVADRKATPVAPFPGTIRLSFPGHQTDARILDPYFDKDADWALLECVEAPVGVRPVPLSELTASGDPFVTYGFPKVQDLDGLLQSGVVEDHHARLFGTPALQLFSQQAAAGTGADVSGASGSPVIVDGALVGVLRFALMDKRRATRAGTLYACPVSTVIDHTDDRLPVPDPCRGLPGLRRRPLPAVPFSYLNRFTTEDAEIFYGRNRDIRRLYDLLTTQDAPPIVLLYGQAGVGKSSFLDAGIRPRLEWAQEVRYVRRTGRENLLDTLKQVAEPLERLRGGGRVPLVVFLDQVEEIFTEPRAGDELAELMVALQAIGTNDDGGWRGRLVLSFRKEWLGELQKSLESHRLGYAKVFLEGLDRESIIEVVTGLTSTRRVRDRYGLRVDPDVAARVATDLGRDKNSPIAPTLAILLTKLWNRATAQSQSAPAFTLELYESLKRRGLLLGDFLDQQLVALAKTRPSDVASGLAHDLLAFHTTPLQTSSEQPTGQVTARYQHRAEAASMLVREMTRLRLLVDPSGDQTGAVSSTRLSHDTLAPLVRQRFDDSDRPGQRARRILESRRIEWTDGASGASLDDADLRVVDAGLAGMRHLEPDEQRLVAASQVDRDQRRRVKRAALAVVAGLAGLAAVLGLWAETQRREANRQSRAAWSAALTAQASEMLDTDPTTAALLLAELDDYPEPPLGIRTANLVAGSPLPTHVWRGAADVTSVDLSLGGRLVVAGYADGAALLWNPENGPARADRLIDHGDAAITSALFNSAGTVVVTTSEEDLRLTAVDGTGDHSLVGHDAVFTVAFSPDGQRLLTASRDMVMIWNTRARSPVAAPIDPDDQVRTARFDRTGERFLVVAGNDVQVYQVGQEEPEHVLSHDFPVNVAAFSPDGRTIGTGARSQGAVTLWSIASDAPTSEVHAEEHTGRIEAIAFSPDGQRFVTASQDTTARVWQVASGRSVRLRHPLQPVADARFSSDGRQVVTRADDGVRIWSVERPGGEPLRTMRHQGRVLGFALSDSGRLATTSDDDAVRIWQVDRVSQPTMLYDHGQSVRLAAFSPDRSSVAVASDRGVSVFPTDPEQRGAPVVIEVPDARIDALAFGPTGAELMAVSRTTLHVWRLADSATLVKTVSGDLLSGAFSPDAASIVVGGRDGLVQVVPLDGGPAVPLSGHEADVPSVTFDRGGTRIASASRDRTVRIWTVDGRELAVLSHDEEVEIVAFSPDGEQVVTGDRNYVVRVWQTDSPASPPLELPAHDDGISSLSLIARDGVRLLSLARSGVVRVRRADGVGEPAEFEASTFANRIVAAAFTDEGAGVLTVSAAGRTQRWVAGWPELVSTLQEATTGACLTVPERMRLLGEDRETAEAEAARRCGP